MQLSDKNSSCLNCGKALQGYFCAGCGQAANTGKISFKETFSNFFAIAFALEGPLWLTIRLLIVNPGKLFREYIAGRRKSYYKPVAFFILATAVYLILRVWIKFDPLEGEFTNGQTDLAEFSNKSEEVFRSMEDNINYILFFLVFSIAINFKLFFKNKYNLAEYTSIGLYITGVYTLMKIITMFFGKFTAAEVDNTELGILLLLIFYSSFSLFQKKKLGYFVRYVLVSFFSLILYIIFGLGFFFLIVSLK